MTIEQAVQWLTGLAILGGGMKWGAAVYAKLVIMASRLTSMDEKMDAQHTDNLAEHREFRLLFDAHGRRLDNAERRLDGHDRSLDELES